jgi:hypothetical protein
LSENAALSGSESQLNTRAPNVEDNAAIVIDHFKVADRDRRRTGIVNSNRARIENDTSRVGLGDHGLTIERGSNPGTGKESAGTQIIRVTNEYIEGICPRAWDDINNAPNTKAVANLKPFFRIYPPYTLSLS